MSERQAVTKELKSQYNQGSKKKKGEILNWLVEVAGYNRNYAARLLRGRVKRNNQRNSAQQKTKPGRKKTYDEEVFLALRRIWFTEGCICGKRLAPFLKELVPILKRFIYLRYFAGFIRIN